MQKIYVLLLGLFTVSTSFAQSEEELFTTDNALGFELAFSDAASMNNWSISYTGQDSLSPGFFIGNTNRSRQAWPSLVLRNQFDFGKIFIPFEVGFAVSRDQNNFYGIGLGYKYIIEQEKWDVGFHMSATYTYQNIGLRAGVADIPDNRELVVNGRNFVRDKVVIGVGNRVHQIRPRLGLSLGNESLSVLLEGWYGAPIDIQERVFVRGQTLFSRRASLLSTDAQLDVRNAVGDSVVDWDFSQQFGISLVFISYLQ